MTKVTDLGIEAWRSDVRLEGSKSWSQYLKWASVDGVLLIRVVGNKADHLAMKIYEVTLQKGRKGERERGKEGRERRRKRRRLGKHSYYQFSAA